jgi:hypothetical protein
MRSSALSDEDLNLEALSARVTASLTEHEKNLFASLLAASAAAAAAAAKSSNVEENEMTIVRVAGGWVRDKLLGLGSIDIDITLNNVTGHEFALKVNEHRRHLREEETTTTPAASTMTGLAVSGVKDDGGSESQKKKKKKKSGSGAGGASTDETNEKEDAGDARIGVISANPLQSKHLETATMMLDGLSIDFTNLRSETYDETSRIPLVTFGTAFTDAERRDFTINALFYNLNTSLVEDLTGRGIEDLLGKTKVIRTPLDPNVTFSDDPLRVLRAIRFAARFRYELAVDLKVAASSKEVRDALLTKVSRERLGVELEGMMPLPSSSAAAAEGKVKATTANIALGYIHTFGLTAAVFPLPERCDVTSFELDTVAISAIASLCPQQQQQQQQQQQTCDSSIILEERVMDRVNMRLLYLCAALSELIGVEYVDGK